ncbi:hypothetical protein CP983_24645 [Streptomyces chartreusis]|nr:hypothetical protein CP983_24645 [Streptomyces chartreusis]
MWIFSFSARRRYRWLTPFGHERDGAVGFAREHEGVAGEFTAQCLAAFLGAGSVGGQHGACDDIDGLLTALVSLGVLDPSTLLECFTTSSRRSRSMSDQRSAHISPRREPVTMVMNRKVPQSRSLGQAVFRTRAASSGVGGSGLGLGWDGGSARAATFVVT